MVAVYLEEPLGHSDFQHYHHTSCRPSEFHRPPTKINWDNLTKYVHCVHPQMYHRGKIDNTW